MVRAQPKSAALVLFGSAAIAFSILTQCEPGCQLPAAVPFIAQDKSPAKEQPKPANADWLLFRGNPLQTGVVKASLPDKLEVLWKVTFKADFESTAAIMGDTVYVGNFDEHLYALDLATGKQKWKYKAGDAFKAPISASEKDGAVYAGDEGGMFHCVDARTGKLRWSFATEGEIAGGANFDGDHVLIGSHDATLYCLAKKDGSVVWKFKTQGPVNGSALVAGKQTFVAGCDGELHILDLKTGNELASIPLEGQAAATAAVIGDRLYVGTMTNDFHEIDLDRKKIAWTYVPKRGQPFYSSAAVTDNLVVVGGRDKLVHALKRKTGDIVWTFATKNRVDSSPVVAGERVYVGSSDGFLYVLNLADGKEVQKIELGRGIVASPAIAQGRTVAYAAVAQARGRLVIGTTNGHLYCLGKK